MDHWNAVFVHAIIFLTFCFVCVCSTTHTKLQKRTSYYERKEGDGKISVYSCATAMHGPNRWPSPQCELATVS